MTIRRIAVAFLVLALAGCAHKPAEVKEAPPKLIVKKIAILPVLELTTVSIENKNNAAAFLFPIAGSGVAISNKSKQKAFSEKFMAQKPALGSNLTAYLSRALQKEGYAVVILEGVPRPADDPERIDLEKITTDADAILHVYFDEVGLLSPSLSTEYVPRVNIRATLQATQRDEELYDEKLCYGVDARAGKSWAVVSDPKLTYPSFEVVMAKLPEVAELFEAGTQAIGKHLVAQLKIALN